MVEKDTGEQLDMTDPLPPLVRNLFVVTMAIHHVGEDGKVDRPSVMIEQFVTDEAVECAAIPVLPLTLRDTAEKMVKYVEESI